MKLEELILAWKKQDAYVGEHLKIDTLRHLLTTKSKNAVSHIRTSLIHELLFILLISLVFDGLFFLIDIPFTTVRWACFVIFNLIAGWYGIFYERVIRESQFDYERPLRMNLRRIVQSVTRFRSSYQVNNVPVVLLCFLMFAGAQDLLILLPWMITEFLILRWVMMPRLTSRFDDYKADLEYSLKQLEESGDSV